MSNTPLRKKSALTWWAVGLGTTLVAISAFVAYQWTEIRRDRDTTVAVAASLTSLRLMFDGASLNARYDAALQDVADSQKRTVAEVQKSVLRFANGGPLGTKRAGYDAFLAQIANRRFEAAIATLRDLANAARNSSTPQSSDWQLLALTAILEFSRGRAIAAEPLAQQAFDLANRRDLLDTPGAATLLAAYGGIHLSRSRPADAEPYFRRAASILRKSPGVDLRDRAWALKQYAQAVAEQGFPEEGEPLCAEALTALAEFRRTSGRSDGQQPVLEEAYRRLLRQQGLAEAEISRRVEAMTPSSGAELP